MHILRVILSDAIKPKNKSQIIIRMLLLQGQIIINIEKERNYSNK